MLDKTGNFVLVGCIISVYFCGEGIKTQVLCSSVSHACFINLTVDFRASNYFSFGKVEAVTFVTPAK